MIIAYFINATTYIDLSILIYRVDSNNVPFIFIDDVIFESHVVKNSFKLIWSKDSNFIYYYFTSSETLNNIFCIYNITSMLKNCRTMR